MGVNANLNSSNLSKIIYFFDLEQAYGGRNLFLLRMNFDR